MVCVVCVHMYTVYRIMHDICVLSKYCTKVDSCPIVHIPLCHVCLGFGTCVRTMGGLCDQHISDVTVVASILECP